jgi:hypothetical protein
MGVGSRESCFFSGGGGHLGFGFLNRLLWRYVNEKLDVFR